MLFSTDNEGSTAWKRAAKHGRLELLHKIWECAEEKLTTERVKSKLLLGTHSEGITAWQRAATYGRLDLLHKIWGCAEEILTIEEIKINLFIGHRQCGNDRLGKGSSVWQVRDIT